MKRLFSIALGSINLPTMINLNEGRAGVLSDKTQGKS